MCGLSLETSLQLSVGASRLSLFLLWQLGSSRLTLCPAKKSLAQETQHVLQHLQTWIYCVRVCNECADGPLLEHKVCLS